MRTAVNTIKVIDSFTDPPLFLQSPLTWVTLPQGEFSAPHNSTGYPDQKGETIDK